MKSQENHIVEFKPFAKQYQALQLLNDNKTNEVLYWGGARGWKAQPLYSKILTPDWWIRMWEIKIWQSLISPSWWTTKVIAIHPQWKKDIYEVEFDTWIKVRCCLDHLWLSWKPKRWQKTLANRSLREIKDFFDRWIKIKIPTCEALDFWKPYTKLHPYLVGALLWDWWLTTGAVIFTTEDQELIDSFKRLLPKWISISKYNWRKYAYRILSSYRKAKWYLWSKMNDILNELWMKGVRCEKKKIPRQIMEGDLYTRSQCIKGLMDTDWTVWTNWRCSLTAKSKQLALDFQYLIRSIGGRANLITVNKFCTYKWKKRRWVYYEVIVTLSDRSLLFNLTRKKDRWTKYQGGRSRMGLVIKNIKYIWKQEAQCITVSKDDWLYITNDFMVTHNSYIWCFWVVSKCLEYNGSQWLIWRCELKRLKLTTMITLFDIIKMLGLKKPFYKYNALDWVIEFQNWSRIFLTDLQNLPSDPNFDRLWSYWLTGVFLDEAQEINSKCISVLRWRLSVLSGEGWETIPKMLFTCNPARNWIYYDYYKPYKEGNLEPTKAFVPALVTDNPSIKKEYVDNLKKWDHVTVQRLLYGNFEYSDEDWLLLDIDSVSSIFKKDSTIDEDKKFYLSCDVARKGNDKTVIMLWRWLTVLQVFHQKKTDLQELAQQIIRISMWNNIPRNHIVIDEDWLWGWVIDQIRGCRGFINNARAIEERRATKDLAKRANYANLKSQCYFKLCEQIKLWIVHVNCDEFVKEQLTQELLQIKIKDLDKDWKFAIEGKELVKERLWRSPDFSDCMAMRMLFELKRPKIIFKYF